MGTFRAVATVFSFTGAIHHVSGNFYTVDDPNVASSGTVNYQFIGNCFFLDGSGTPIDFASLPAGFTVDPVSLLVNSGISGFNFGIIQRNDPANVTAANVTVGPFSNSVTTDVGTSSTTINQPDFQNPRDFVALDFQSLWIVSGTTAVAVPDNSSVFSISFVDITGNYSIVSSQFQFQLDLPAEPKPGQEITLTSDPEATNPPPMPMQDVTEIHYTWNDGTDHEIIQTNFDTQYLYLLIFLIPFGFGDFTGTVNISAVVVSTEFSGSVPLGSMEILFENGSGIYKLTRGKKFDTLYSPDRDGTTVDVKIPNPFGRTGFIGG